MGGKEAVIVSSFLLHAVHGRIGILHESLWRISVIGKEADADTGRGEELTPLDAEGFF